jgi:hypothetical protein
MKRVGLFVFFKELTYVVVGAGQASPQSKGWTIRKDRRETQTGPEAVSTAKFLLLPKNFSSVLKAFQLVGSGQQENLE